MNKIHNIEHLGKQLMLPINMSVICRSSLHRLYLPQECTRRRDRWLYGGEQSNVSVCFGLKVRVQDHERGWRGIGQKRMMTRCSAETYGRDLSATPRLIQHKNEAKAFYAFLSMVYDHIVNPGHWTVDMRDEALEPARLDASDLSVCDVGGGTGFCTQGIVKSVDPKNVTLLDQSPQQLSKARKKKDLEEVTILEGDAEDLPFETDSFDR